MKGERKRTHEKYGTRYTYIITYSACWEFRDIDNSDETKTNKIEDERYRDDIDDDDDGE